MDDKAVASAISDFNAAAKAMGHAYDAELVLRVADASRAVAGLADV